MIGDDETTSTRRVQYRPTVSAPVRPIHMHITKSTKAPEGWNPCRAPYIADLSMLSLVLSSPKEIHRYVWIA